MSPSSSTTTRARPPSPTSRADASSSSARPSTGCKKLCAPPSPKALGYNVLSGADEELFLEFRCETLVRAVMRAHFSNLAAEELPEDETLVSAMIVITSRGASVGLYSPARGLFLEDAEPFDAGEE